MNRNQGPDLLSSDSEVRFSGLCNLWLWLMPECRDGASEGGSVIYFFI